MEEDLKSRPLPNMNRLSDRRYEDIAVLSKKIEAALGRVVFSSVLKNPHSASDSVQMLLLLDDFNAVVFNQQVDGMKLKASEIAYTSTLPVKCEVMLASSFWELFKSRDESAMVILRNGLILYDRGFLLPLQELLVTGKVRPSKESVNVYFVKAEQSVKSSGQHVQKAVLDLYWAVLDAAHAAVMISGITPPSPQELVEIVRRDFVGRKLVNPRCGEIIRRVYDAAKKIMHREVFEISGREFDNYLKDADFFIKEMDEFVKEHAK